MEINITVFTAKLVIVCNQLGEKRPTVFGYSLGLCHNVYSLAVL